MCHKIEKLKSNDFYRCNNIWDMNRHKELADRFYRELIAGNRVTFVYIQDEKFIGEGSIVFDTSDPDYTIKEKRVYFSRLIVKKGHRHRGIGSAIIDFVINYVKELGYSEISIGVDIDNFPARNLYAQKGFTHVLYQGTDEQGEYQKLLKAL